MEFYTPVARPYPLAQYYRFPHSDMLSIFWMSTVQHRLAIWFPPSP